MNPQVYPSGSVTWISRKLPLGFAYPQRPSTHLFTYPDLGLAIANGFAAEQPGTPGVNVAVLVLRKDPVDAQHFRTPTVLPVVGALACAYLATPWAGRPAEQYKIAGVLLAIGVVLWGVTVLVNKRTGGEVPRLDPTRLTGDGPTGPRN